VIVAIDGPAGAGKSTVARALSERLGIGHLDTGSMYRAVTWLALSRSVDPDDADALTRLAETHPVRLTPSPKGVAVEVAGQDVTDAIRSNDVSAAVSQVSAHAGVRHAVTGAQRALLAHGDWVSDGRDVGTVVWPEAEVKVFLTATPGERADRRLLDMRARGVEMDHATVLSDISRRDHLDATRIEAPLRAADDAVIVDTSDLQIDEVVALLENLVADARASRQNGRR
jgi:cytidylate kinase